MLKKIFSKIKRKYYGFITGHYYLNSLELKSIRLSVGKNSSNIVEDFEKDFSLLIGDGKCVSYASGRMALYCILKSIDIKEGDEIIVLGFTCSVVLDAILRTGAVPIFSDVDPHTFGSSASSIDSLISKKTKVAIAQHSFGIPCDIDVISKLCNKKGVFLIEDCALTLGSELHNIRVGNYGDAAIFSTDHSKPINTIIGGLAYTKDISLLRDLRGMKDASPSLSIEKQKSLWYRLLVERIFCRDGCYSAMVIIDLAYGALRKFSYAFNPFLVSDIGVENEDNEYYPAKMPTFLAQVGILEIKRWHKVQGYREGLLKKILSSMKNNGTKIPEVYLDSYRQITPLRVAFCCRNFKKKSAYESFLYSDGFWFKNPIISTKRAGSFFGYVDGQCLNSERIGKSIVNISCNISGEGEQDLLSRISSI